MVHPHGNTPDYDDIASKEKGLYTQEEGVTQTDDNLMIYRTHTNLTDTLEHHSDVKNKANADNIEKGYTTAIDIPSSSTNDEKAEQLSQDSEEEVKKVSRLTLFYRRHLKWFQ